jgi:endonuclease/exonuclease/phosphatase family metal-dependent hydrolase
MRVVTQNLRGRRGDWAGRRAVLVEGLRDLEPDLVALPEAIVNDEYDRVLDVLGPATSPTRARGSPVTTPMWRRGRPFDREPPAAGRRARARPAHDAQPREGVWASDHFGLVADLEVP